MSGARLFTIKNPPDTKINENELCLKMFKNTSDITKHHAIQVRVTKGPYLKSVWKMPLYNLQLLR